MLGIYIHVPFCAKICNYCDFRVISAPSRLYYTYTKLLCSEIEAFNHANPDVLSSAETLYLGGGTPSILPEGCLNQIFDTLRGVGVKVENLREVSMEFNPESCSSEKIKMAMDNGVGRFSLGLQTFNGGILKKIGRSHTVEQGKLALERLASTKGIEVSADLMFNLPGQTLESFIQDVDALSQYALNHISFYGLTISPKTLLGQHVSKNLLSVDDSLYEPMYLEGVKLLESRGFCRYEVSNFAHKGYESIHNQNYWNRGDYIGFGPGAHSYFHGVRFYAPEVYSQWKTYVEKGCSKEDLVLDKLTIEDVWTEWVWLSLRQNKGLNLSILKEAGIEIPKSLYEAWQKKDFLHFENQHLRLIGRGWVFMDQIVTDILNMDIPIWSMEKLKNIP
ncbi:MAG: radical SAM family heme chaperone HemW [Fibrobacteraceae bacterium]|nr:radical SAM family heme chaperone HemW [Fibrobacteraceae bacterium]